MNKYDRDYNRLGIGELIDLEEDLNCDIHLYRDSIHSLQSDFQQKKISLAEFNESCEILTANMTDLIDKRINLTVEINSRIQGNRGYGDNGGLEEYLEFYHNNDFLNGGTDDEYYND